MKKSSLAALALASLAGGAMMQTTGAAPERSATEARTSANPTTGALPSSFGSAIYRAILGGGSGSALRLRAAIAKTGWTTRRYQRAALKRRNVTRNRNAHKGAR